METTASNTISSPIKILEDFQSFLRDIWKEDNERTWSIYTKDQFSRFWDVHTVEHRTK